MIEPRLDETIFGDRPPPTTRAERRSREPRDRSGRTRLAVLLGVVLIVAALVFAFGALTPMVSSFFSRNDYAGPGTGTVEYTVEEGATGSQIAAGLAKLDVIKTQSSFIEAANGNPSASNSIQPGTYQLKKQMSAGEALAILGDPNARVSTGITIPEGKWASEIYATLAKSTGHKVADYEKAANTVKLPNGITAPDQAKYRLEGWLFPKTYNFSKQDSPKSQLQRMVDETTQELTDLKVPRAKWERTLTLASIVEGESSGKVDRGKVARVVENRLVDQTGLINGRLQMDSTIHYIMQKRGNVETTDAERAQPDPYNTYLNTGLPPGPINNPGVAAIEAAVSPDPGSWLYFVTIDSNTGETLFASTFEEHQRNIQKWQNTK